MGCDIHVFAERRAGSKWQCIPMKMPFDQRSYGMFGFLAGVRNYSMVTPIAPPRGFPNDASDIVKEQKENWHFDGHTHSWLTVEEMVNFDYHQVMEDRRVTIDGNGGCTCEAGEGEKMSIKHFLGQFYFDELQRLQDAGAERIVFWFDN